MSDPDATAGPEPGRDTLDRPTIVAIVAMGLAVFLIANDFVSLSVALPTMEQDLNTDISRIQWVVSGYALIFGVLIVPGGRLADMFGRKKILVIGAVIFGLFSLTAALSPGVNLLIISRMLMGVGGALMWPAILGLIYAILPESRAGLAGGLVIGVAGIGNATGPLLGGALTEFASWRWVLAINVPITAIAVLVTWRTVHVANPTERDPIDLPGITLLSGSLIALLVALTEAPEIGFADPLVVGLLVLSAVLMVGFVLRERGAGDTGLVPPHVIENREFMAACIATTLMSATFFATVLYVPQFFQKILDMSAFGAGLALLPLMVTFALLSFGENSIVNRIGEKAAVTSGAFCLVLGSVLLVAIVDRNSSYSDFLPGLVILGIGIGLFYSSVTNAGLAALDPSESSLAGGILYMFQVAGGAVGLGLTTAVFLTTSNNEVSTEAEKLGVDLSASETTDIQGVLAGTETSQELLASNGSHADDLIEIATDAFVAGFRWSCAFVAALGLAGLAVTALEVAGPIRRFGRDKPTRETAGTS